MTKCVPIVTNNVWPTNLLETELIGPDYNWLIQKQITYALCAAVMLADAANRVHCLQESMLTSRREEA